MFDPNIKSYANYINLILDHIVKVLFLGIKLEQS